MDYPVGLAEKGDQGTSQGPGQPRRVERVSVGVPGLRASASFGTTLIRALRISALGVTVELLSRDRPQEKDIQRALDALSEASVLVADLEQDLKHRMQDLTRLKEEYKHYSQLTAVEEGKAKALLEEVEATVGRGRPKERWVAAAINLFTGLILFVLGIVVQRYWLSPGK